MQKPKLSNILSIAIAVIFISLVVTIVYMKYSKNCGLLGTAVQQKIGPVICGISDGTPDSSEANPMLQLEQLPPDGSPGATPDSTAPPSTGLFGTPSTPSTPPDPNAPAPSAGLFGTPSTPSTPGTPDPNAPPADPNLIPATPDSLPVIAPEAVIAAETIKPALRPPSGRQWPTEAPVTAAPLIPPTPEVTAAPPEAPTMNDPTIMNPTDSLGNPSVPGAPGDPNAAPGTIDPNAQAAPPPPPPAYETPALLIADNKLKITSLTSGKVKSLAFKDGEEFKKDDVLITFDCKDTELDLDIQREILKDRAESLKNLSKLKELKSTSSYSIVKATSEVAQTKKLIEKYENELKNCVIKADYSGKVIVNRVTETEFLQAGQEIMSVNNSEQLLVKAYVPVVWLEWLKIGSSFQLCFDKNVCYKGVVNRMGAEVDAISQTLDIFGKLTTTDLKLIAGLSGQVTFDR